MKILIADDEPLLRELLIILLSELKNDLQILEAEDGEKAIELFNQHQFDLCILDLQMPKKNGTEVFEYISQKESWPISKAKTPVIILSGYIDKVNRMTNKEDHLASLMAHKHVISKPFKSEEFKERVKKILKL